MPKLISRGNVPIGTLGREKEMIIPLKDINSETVKGSFCYILCFSDGSMYVGSATNVYRLYVYKSIAQKQIVSVEHTLHTALKTFCCNVEVIPCENIVAARKLEETVYTEVKNENVFLHNVNRNGKPEGGFDKELHEIKKKIDPNFVYSTGTSKSSVKKSFLNALKNNKPLRLVDKLKEEELMELLMLNRDFRAVKGTKNGTKNRMKRLFFSLINEEINEAFKDW